MPLHPLAAYRRRVTPVAAIQGWRLSGVAWLDGPVVGWLWWRGQAGRRKRRVGCRPPAVRRDQSSPAWLSPLSSSPRSSSCPAWLLGGGLVAEWETAVLPAVGAVEADAAPPGWMEGPAGTAGTVALEIHPLPPPRQREHRKSQAVAGEVVIRGS